MGVLSAVVMYVLHGRSGCIRLEAHSAILVRSVHWRWNETQATEDNPCSLVIGSAERSGGLCF